MNEEQFVILMGLMVVGEFLIIGLRTLRLYAKRITVRQRVTAREFVLLGRAGKSRLQMKAEEDGAISLLLMDSLGAHRLSIATGEGEPCLTMFDKDGTPRTAIGIDRDRHGPALDLFDGQGNQCMTLAMDDDYGSPCLTMFDGAGAKGPEMYVDEDGTAALAITDSAGNPRLHMAVLRDGTHGLAMYDSTGEQRLHMAVDKDDHPFVHLIRSQDRVWSAP